MASQLFINDIALINALGSNKEQIADNLFNGEQSGIALNDSLLSDGSIHVASVNLDLPSLSHFDKKFQTRNNQLGLLALQQLLPCIESLKKTVDKHRIGVILGTSTSGIFEGELGMKNLLSTSNWPDDYDYQMQEMGNIAEFIALAADIDGIAFCISTACSSSAKSFVTAQELIDAGVIDAAIVGGVDTLCGITVNGFSALESTSSGICNPSSVNRDGINIGEAAALAIVSKQSSQYCLAGWGESSDAHHMSAPHPEGKGAIASMTQAIKKANINTSQIGYINLHGTATPKNDEMEAIAVDSLFGNTTPVSSTKSLIGHTLGAAGATELGFCYLVLEYQKLAPHVWDKVEDPNLPKLNFINENRPNAPIHFCLTNSFAFGGNNVSLILGKNAQ